jgi:hypothetical protein
VSLSDCPTDPAIDLPTLDPVTKIGPTIGQTMAAISGVNSDTTANVPRAFSEVCILITDLERKHARWRWRAFRFAGPSIAYATQGVDKHDLPNLSEQTAFIQSWRILRDIILSTRINKCRPNLR